MNDARGALAGRRAVVTGGGSGIGRAIALALAGAGADVAVTARRIEALEAVAGEIRSSRSRALAVACDVGDPRQVERMASAVLSAFGGVDILINSAGSSAAHKLLGHPDELWHRMLADNLTSVYYVCKAFLPALVEVGSGRIVNIASTAAKVGTRLTAAYSAAKHGVLGLTRVLAAELSATRITVNAICPGFVETPMTARSIDSIVRHTGMSRAEAETALRQTNPQGRLIQPEEVAAVVLFLVDERSGGLTGQAINVDGGALAW